MMPGRLNLLFDADDTLWENNIYYEQVRDRFLPLTDALGVARRDAETQIDLTEQRNIRLYGYGSENFIRSLKETYIHYAGQGDHLQATLELIESFAQALYDFKVDILQGVADTLEVLSGRHRCILLTKGDDREQRAKVTKSTLEPLFERVEVVPEKNVDTYEEMVKKLSLEKASTWMIGNSPRSDINPALAAGLGAVYIPHAVTWHFEKVPLTENHPRLLVVAGFVDLLKYF